MIITIIMTATQESRHCDKKLARLPHRCKTIIVCCADAKGESMSLRQG